MRGTVCTTVTTPSMRGTVCSVWGILFYFPKYFKVFIYGFPCKESPPVKRQTASFLHKLNHSHKLLEMAGRKQTPVTTTPSSSDSSSSQQQVPSTTTAVAVGGASPVLSAEDAGSTIGPVLGSESQEIVLPCGDGKCCVNKSNYN